LKYRLIRPSVEDVQDTAARLRKADDEAILAADDKAKAQAARLADDLRAHAARQVLPAEWRSRDRTKTPEWPPPDDLRTWEALGSSHALAMLTPAILPTNPEPFAQSYCKGYMSTQQGYMMPEQHIQLNPVAAAARRHDVAEKALGNYLLTGNVADLNPDDRAALLVALAKHTGLDPLERPFGLMLDKGTWIVYARAACTDGLARTRGLSTAIVGQNPVEVVEVCGHEMLRCRAVCTVMETGRSNEAIGMLPTVIFTRADKWHRPDPGEAANLYMKVTTKARRRAVLSCVGLGGIPDVSELDTIDPPNEGFHYTADPEDDPDPEIADVDPPHPDEAGA
jgi:hypothetical protein